MITVYSTPTCPWCHRLKDWMKENNIKFKDADVSKDRALAMEMVQKSGQMGVPVTDANGTIIIGFDKDSLKKALNLK